MMSPIPRIVAAIAWSAALGSVALVTGCTTTSPGTAEGGRVPSMQRGDRYVITAGELTDAGANNLYDAIVKVRPDFFKPRGNTLAAGGTATSTRGSGPPAEVSGNVGTAVASTQVPVKVYHDDQMLMGPDDLRQIPLSTVAEVRFIPGPQAGVRYGTNHSSGVILVKSR